MTGIKQPIQPQVIITADQTAGIEQPDEGEPPSISPGQALNDKIEKWAYAIGRHESANFKKCPGDCENSHNYWGRTAKSGGYAKFESDETAWADQKEYLKIRIERGCDTLEKLRDQCGYATDPEWPDKVKQFL